MFKRFAVVVLSFLALSTSMVSAAEYNVDPAHSQVNFSVKHLMMFKVRGVFSDFTAKLEADAATRTLQSVSAVVQIASLDTQQPKRDGHLKSPDFFAAKQYPTMTFVSNRIQGKGDDIKVYGDLTIRGITKKVAFKGEFMGVNTDPWGNERAGFEATAKISRKSFGLEYNPALETGGVVVGDEVTITLEIQAIRKK
ncbi:MAG: hypothetical protein COB67_03160 [SAR324 cluster bacterium]|uniref:Lipid/polyisoprenoid-binding YceI-like domain-containing protein n=1 Tax=SAR324 cluster bacterium TaxID=2024889 RepID=A0A2A4T9D4_9DELT|nr:MAG: hypothetical protein COB67_03160 [SAR324 cluster bacterium]